MPRRKQAKRTTVKDIRRILRLTSEGMPVRRIAERLRISKTTVSSYLVRAQAAGLSWPIAAELDSDTALERALFRRMGRPSRDVSEPDWARVTQELKRPGVRLLLLWQ